MLKVVALALSAGCIWLFTRAWKPTPLGLAVVWAGLRGLLLGLCLSSLSALLLIGLTPNVRHQPFHLSIYLLGCNLIVTPLLGAWQVLMRLRQLPHECAPQEKPSFQGMLDEITQPATPEGA